QVGKTGGKADDDPLHALKDLDLVAFYRADGKKKSKSVDALPATHLSNPYDGKADLTERARSYLHANCAHCHQFGAGGTANFDLRYTQSLKETKTVDVTPVQGAFDMKPAAIVMAGDPYSSTLYYRMAKLGPGRMPHIGSDFVDERGLQLLHDWIASLPSK